MNTSTGEMLLCTHCVTDRRFVEWIRKNGRRGRCDFDPKHGNRRKVVTVETFAVPVDEFFREHYQLGEEEPHWFGDSDSPDYVQRGSTLLEILSDELSSDGEAVVEAIIENLPDVSHRDIAQGAEPFYDDTVNYESIADFQARERTAQEEYWYEHRFIYQWEEFCEKVQYERRFFETKGLLDKLFGKPTEYEGGQINPVYMLKAGERIFRARVLDDGFTEAMLRADARKHLGAPPKDRARAGRLNVEYIPAFYGAFSEDVAVAELRPGVGEKVAIGEFALRRDIKAFDFTAFSRAPHEKWREIYVHTRYDFIRQMEDEISRPVLPFEKQLQYIPTQIVAEYLKEYFACDSVIYRSAMTADRSVENRNIVLLPRADSFVGEDDGVLDYLRYHVKEVRNVTYQLIESPF